MKDLHELTAVELRKLLMEGTITAEGLTRYYLRRIEAYDKTRDLNSIAFLTLPLSDKPNNLTNAETKRISHCLACPFSSKTTWM